MTLRSTSALSFFALAFLGAGPAGAYTAYVPFFAQNLGICPGPFPCSISDTAASKLTEIEFRNALVDPLEEDFSSFHSGDEGTLDLSFEDIMEIPSLAATLTDPSSDRYGYIGTGPHADRGFPITGTPFWKNRTQPGEGLFTVDFGTDVRAFGFYATGYSTLAEAGSTQLVLRLDTAGGGSSLEIEIPHVTTEQPGSAFYFGVITDLPFRFATLLNQSCENDDVIGFDDFTVAIVPEPATGLLLAGGLCALAAARRSRARRQSA